MSNLSVVIPSRNIKNLLPCVAQVRHLEPSVRIIAVDDGLEFKGGEVEHFIRSNVELVPGEKPFVFSMNVNLGIDAAGTDDVIVLNDDALLKTPGGFSLLQAVAEGHPEFGVIASTTNNVGNRNQFPHSIGLREDPRMVCFVCVLIPRRTIEAVGLLDPRFTAYGHEDDDFCLRVRREGLKIGIADQCFVDHASLKSTFRGDPSTSANLEGGRQIFIDKWGSYPL